MKRAAAPAQLCPGGGRGGELHQGGRPAAPGPAVAEPPGAPHRGGAGGPAVQPWAGQEPGEAPGAEARALSGMARGRLSIGATPSLITRVLAPALVEFHTSYPGIELLVVEAGSHQLVPQLASGEVDLALVVLPVADPLVVTTPLFDDPLVLATAPNHPFARRRRVAGR